MLYTILIILGFVLVSTLIILLIRFIFFLQKIIENVNQNINEITNEVKAVRKDISCALEGVDILLNDAANTIDKTNKVFSQMKNAIDTISVPVTKVQKYTSIVGTFLGTLKGKLKSNKKNI